MLQINTGKLYERSVGVPNQLTGVLFSNVRLPHQRSIVTRAGTLRSTGSGVADLALVYDLEERLESADPAPGVVFSHTVRPYLDDFAVVASFGLGGIFAREPETVRALTSGRASFSSYEPPAKYVSGFFDRSIYITDAQADAFVEFVDLLLALERRSYLGAMRAMRTFVAGLHRIAEDLALAYTLIVSSVETLAQDFDGYGSSWSDVDENKRCAIDEALDRVDQVVADGVRGAIVKTEHLALSRRYRAFIQSRVDAGFFLHPSGGSHPMVQFELDAALRQAYKFRSVYIHQMQSLPTAIALPFGDREVTSVERRPALTFQGLFRLTRHVMSTFVDGGPKVEREAYDYSLERAGIISMEVSAEHWVWRPLPDPGSARRWLEGLLSLTAAVVGRHHGASLVDLRLMLADLERLLPQAAPVHRPAMLSLHILFNLQVAPELRTLGFDAFLNRHRVEASRPSVEALIVTTIFNANQEWAVEEHRAVLEQYFIERTRPKGLHAPRLFEAAACLALAEKYRLSGDIASARYHVDLSIGVHPSHAALRAFKEDYVETMQIDWRSILLPGESVLA